MHNNSQSEVAVLHPETGEAVVLRISARPELKKLYNNYNFVETSQYFNIENFQISPKNEHSNQIIAYVHGFSGPLPGVYEMAHHAVVSDHAFLWEFQRPLFGNCFLQNTLQIL